MDGLARAAGSGVPVKMAGRTYYMSALSRQGWGEIEQKLLADRKSYLDIAKEKLDGLPTHLQQDLLREALKQDGRRPNYITDEEMEAYMNSPDGIAYSMWISMRDAHPDMTLEKIYELIQEMGTEDMAKIVKSRDQAAGIDELGNETGLPPTEDGSKATKSSESTNGAKANSEGTAEPTGDTTTDKSSKATQELPTKT